MDNQHRKIEGYRELDADEIDLINDIKEAEACAAELLAELEKRNIQTGDEGARRWAALARTHLETGFMFAIKAVARPTNGLGR